MCVRTDAVGGNKGGGGASTSTFSTVAQCLEPPLSYMHGQDLYVLRRAVGVYEQLVRRFTAQTTDYQRLLSTFAEGLYTEMDFRNEALNASRMAEVGISRCGLVAARVLVRHGGECGRCRGYATKEHASSRLGRGWSGTPVFRGLVHRDFSGLFPIEALHASCMAEVSKIRGLLLAQ